MAAADLKTMVSDANVAAFVASIDNPVRRADAEALLDIFDAATGMEPKMWGPSIIGYGSYHYKYDSGREGDWCRAGFSPRKAQLSIYLMGGYCNPETQDQVDALRGQLGKHKVGASCLYINKLADVDLDVLKALIAFDLSWMDRTYPR